MAAGTAIEVRGNKAPYFLDCRAIGHGLFERAPGAISLVAGEDGMPAKFDNAEEADVFLCGELTATERRAYEWTLISHTLISGRWEGWGAGWQV